MNARVRKFEQDLIRKRAKIMKSGKSKCSQITTCAFLRFWIGKRKKVK